MEADHEEAFDSSCDNLSPAIGEEQISTTVKITSAAVSAAEPAARVLHDAISEIVGGKNGILSSESVHVDRPELSTQQAIRSTRRTIKECIKPGNVIDDDVKECTEGLREKAW